MKKHLTTQNQQGLSTSAVLWAVALLAVIVIGGVYLTNDTNTTDPDPNLNTLYDDNLVNDQDSQQLERIGQQEEDAARGQDISVRGEVAGVYGTQAFRIAEAGPDLVEAEVLVISRNPLPPALAEDANEVIDQEEEIVQVTGSVHTLSIIEIERELGFDLDPEIEVEIDETKPVIIADSVTVQNE